MIKFEQIEVWGIKHAIRGMRNPLNSWGRSDTVFDGDKMCLGENDVDLMTRLIRGGAPHRKFLRQIFVSVDITAPLYWWKEFDTYKVGTTANSCSTMHKIQAKEFTFEDFSCEHLDEPSKAILGVVINELNNNRGWYNDYNRLVSEGDFTDVERKQFWWNMIQLLPSSFNQKRTVTMTYENLLNMLEYRRGHKLDEWRKRSFVFLTRFIGKDKTERCTTNHLPLDKLLVLSGFVLCEHILVEGVNLLYDFLATITADVLNRFATQIPNLEGHNFVCTIFGNLIADFGANVFDTVSDWLVSTVILPQVVNLTAVQLVSSESLTKNINHVFVRDFCYAGLDNAPTAHKSCLT